MKTFWTIIGLLTVLVGASATAEEGPVVAIRLFNFQPAKIEIKQGSTVTWTNQDDIRHTITSGTSDNKDGKFDAPLPGKGKSFSFTFSEPGTYSYFCDRHQHMRGEIQVR
jgi:plastocyanin